MNQENILAPKKVKESRAVKSKYVLPPDTNNYGTIFGGELMALIDNIAAISATRHARNAVVTASTDSVDFLYPVREGEAVCLESYVTWTGKSSIEVFVKVIAENLITGDRKICATSFLTFVAVNQEGKATPVPRVIPETEEEIALHNTAPRRAEARRIRKIENEKFASEFSVKYPWE